MYFTVFLGQYHRDPSGEKAYGLSILILEFLWILHCVFHWVWWQSVRLTGTPGNRKGPKLDRSLRTPDPSNFRGIGNT